MPASLHPILEVGPGAAPANLINSSPKSDIYREHDDVDVRKRPFHEVVVHGTSRRDTETCATRSDGDNRSALSRAARRCGAAKTCAERRTDAARRVGL